MPHDPRLQAASSAYGAALRRGTPDLEEITAAHRELTAVRIIVYVERTLADAPPLTDDQKSLIWRAIGGDK